MGRINREIKLTDAKGKVKTVKASNRVIAKIDGELKEVGPYGFVATLTRMEAAVSAAQGDANSVKAADFPVFSLALIVAMLQEEAGFADVDEDEVYEDIVDDMQNNNAANTVPILESLFSVVSLPGQEEKNQPAPAKSGGGKKAKPKPKT